MEKSNDGQSPAESSQNDQGKMAEKNSVHSLPVETWLQVVAWIERMELAQGASLACSPFNALAHVRLHERSLAVPNDNLRWMRALRIECETVGQSDAKGQECVAVMKAKVNGSYKQIEWPDCPMPANIVRMEGIVINFFDTKVLAFFDRIRPLLAEELHLQITDGSALIGGNFVAMEHILPLCTGPILSISLPNTAIFSSKFPQHWTKCLLLNVYETLLVEVPKLVEWLTERRDDGQPKLLRTFVTFRSAKKFIDLIRQHFIASTHQQVPFFVRLNLHKHNAAEFCEFNERTNEQLSLTRINHYTVVLSRCPIGAALQDEMVKAKTKLCNAYLDGREGVLDFRVAKIGRLPGGGVCSGSVPVLVMSLVFIASVFILHIWGKYSRGH